MDDKNYAYLTKKILKLTKINLDNYKSQQMRRRLNMFLANTGFDNIVSYAAALEKDQEMLQKLRTFLTINVSEFYRDKASFKYLQTIILPKLLKKCSSLNMWSAGCSRGEESYSVAMILNTISPGQNHRILATDIDDNSLKKARDGGPYSASELKNVSPNIINRYFTISNDEYRVIDKMKHKVEVKHQDLLNDQFERGFDLIICRNVTIYFTEETKRALNERFFKSLKDEGILFIGGTEVMLDASSIGFKQVGTSFYQKPENSPPIIMTPMNNLLVKT
ncbi:MAG: protein-glutamate O-methyltransferase CheR [Dehalococcoidales bacterium]